jgi:hypothetical protein
MQQWGNSDTEKNSKSAFVSPVLLFPKAAISKPGIYRGTQAGLLTHSTFLRPSRLPAANSGKR